MPTLKNGLVFRQHSATIPAKNDCHLHITKGNQIMPQSLSNMFAHIIFSTKHRKEMIDEQIESELFSYIAGTCRGLKCPPIEVGGYLNHVHIVCGMGRTTSTSDLLQGIKQNSSLWMKNHNIKYSEFYWQGGYAAISVAESQLADVVQYIRNQKQHHQKVSFQDEYRKILKDDGIDFDERYVWD